MSDIKMELPEEERNNEVVPIEEESNVYKSKEGFIHLPIRRGFQEIKHIYDLVEAYEGYAFICGGYVRYCISMQSEPHPASDVDIYVADEDTFQSLKDNFDEFLGIGHENDISLTYLRSNDPSSPFKYCPPVQPIKPNRIGKIVANFDLGKIEEILENFDFTIIRCAIVSPEEAIADADFEHDDTEGILRVKNIHCPISSTMRIIKYSKKGFYAPPTQILKLFLDWEERDEEYRLELAEYLKKANEGRGLSQEEVDHLEALLRID